MGLAIGIGITVPITPLSDNLFTVGTLSGLVMRGKSEWQGLEGTERMESVDPGFNSTLSLAYFDLIATTVVSCGRYRYVKVPCVDKAASGESLSDMSLKCYGIVISAVHTFDFSSDSE